MAKGIRTKGNYFMLDFNYNNKRYRTTTRLEAIPENIPKAEKLLMTIKIDLERNQFYIDNYRRHLINAQALEELDANYEQLKKQLPVVNLIIAYEEMLKTMVKNNSMEESTYLGYHYAIKNHLTPFFENIRLDQIDSTILEQFIRLLKFSRRKMNMILHPLKDIMAEMTVKGVIQNNPFDQVNKKIYSQIAVKHVDKIAPFSQEEVNLILNNCDYIVIKNIFQVGFWTGMRIGELFALEWEDIDFENELIHINKAATVKRKIKTTKTAAGVRVIEMTPKAKEALLCQIGFTGNDIDRRVFKTPVHKKIWTKPSALREFWLRAVTKANVKYRNQYQMRHTFISYMLSIGNSPMVIYRMVGHATPKVTYEKYARFIKTGVKKLLKYE